MHHRKGQELVEFALVVPILLITILGILAAANAVSANTQITQAAARAALDASNTPNTSNCVDAFAAAQNAVKEVATSSLITVTGITLDCDTGNGGRHDTCSGDESTVPNSSLCPGANGHFQPGNLLTVKVTASVSLSLFGNGPSVNLSNTGAAIIPGTP